MDVIEVAAAIVLNNTFERHVDHLVAKAQVNKEIEVLVSLRKKSAHQGGLWEFPGGKIEQGETVEKALSRELKEELDITIIKNKHLKTVKHSYPDKTVNIHFYLVTEHSGKPCSMEGQAFKWVKLEKLSELEFPQANLDALAELQKLYSF